MKLEGKKEGRGDAALRPGFRSEHCSGSILQIRQISPTFPDQRFSFKDSLDFSNLFQIKVGDWSPQINQILTPPYPTPHPQMQLECVWHKIEKALRTVYPLPVGHQMYPLGVPKTQSRFSLKGTEGLPVSVCQIFVCTSGFVLVFVFLLCNSVQLCAMRNNLYLLFVLQSYLYCSILCNCVVQFRAIRRYDLHLLCKWVWACRDRGKVGARQPRWSTECICI